MKILPQQNFVLIEILRTKETEAPTKLKLFLPEKQDTYKMPNRGRIKAVSQSEECRRMGFQVGDIVCFSVWGDQEKAPSAYRLKISPRTSEHLGTDYDETADYMFLDVRHIFGREKDA